MSEKGRNNNNNSDFSLTSRRTDGGKNPSLVARLTYVASVSKQLHSVLGTSVS